ncbi:MAG: GntR family transcriptional regulator [Streptosporangiaceae bacterium]|nr:GntR family transcriptional regulator [Streptosporangiaceae bacterium]
MSIEFGETPRYLQLAAILREQILSGEIGPKQPIPSKRMLRTQYSVAAGTVDKAVEVLRQEGLVMTVPGLGIFPVAPENRPARDDS